MRRLLLPMMGLLLTACTQGGFKAATSGSTLYLGSINGTGIPLVPASDKVDAACSTSSTYDACLFNKSPVAQTNAALAANTRAGVAGMQIYGVKLTGLSGSGFLENSTLKVTTSRTTRLSTSNLKVNATNGSDLEQVMAYYWMNRTVEYFSARGPLAVRGQGVNVVVDDRVTGFRPQNKTIYLARKEGQLPVAFDASQSVYLLGLANVQYASSGAIDSFAANETLHKICGLDAKGCCSSQSGCARALAAGAATYMAAVMFPEKPVIGELVANRTEGVRLCGVVDRDLRSLASTTVTTAFQSCASRTGDVNILGSVYASIWWKLRTDNPNEAYAIDHLYLRHLSLLSGSDTFSTAKLKILDLDRSLNSSKLSEKIEAEFARRGL